MPTQMVFTGRPNRFRQYECEWLVRRADENLAVPDLVGLSGVHDGLDSLVDLIVVQNHFDLHLGQEIHHIFGAAIQFGVPFLTTKAFDFDHAQTLNADVLQRFLHLVQFEGFDDGFDLLHHGAPGSMAPCLGRSDHFPLRGAIG